MNPIKSLIEYVRTSIAELKKVTWPSKDITIRYTGMVIIVSVALAGFFALLDFGFAKAVTTALAQKASRPAVQQEAPVTPDLTPTTETATPDQNGELKLDLTTSTSVK